MRAWANLYPWDVNGDPAAADRIAGLGLTGVALAAAYHSVRAVTPFHPEHRIVTRDAAVYYRVDPARWRATGIVLSCWDPREAPSLVSRAAAKAPPGTVIAASLLAVAGLGGDPATLPAQAAAVRGAGATEVRLYHAGLAAATDLAAIGSLCSAGA